MSRPVTALHYAAKANDVFVLPDAMIRIKQLIDDDTATMRDIANVVNFDPALMAQILKIANSALYKFPNQIDTVSKAIQVIGTNSVYDLVIAYGVAKAFSEVDKTIIDLDKYWEQSVCCALLAKYFAERLGLKESEKLFVAGLLHNVGELVMVRFNPDAAAKCSQFNEEVTPLSLQLEHVGASYAEIGGTLVKMWGIPDSIADPVSKQHASRTRATTTDEQIIQLCYVLALDNVNQEFYPANANLDSSLYERLGFEPSDLQSALDYINLQSLTVLALFNPSAAATG